MPVVVFLVATAIALAIRHVLIRIAGRRSTSGSANWLVFLHGVRGPSVLWCLVIGLAAAIHNSEAPASFERYAQRALYSFVVISIGLVAANIAIRMVSLYGERKSLRIAGLSQTLINLVILSIVVLMILSEFNVEIKPILTALGVGGLAVALALQDTLANFFAGIHILIEEPIRVGDFISVSKDEEGTVRDIGWRTTRIQTSSNAMIVVPNKNIVSNTLTNFHLPEARVSADIAILTAHEADPDRIAAIALDAALQNERVLQDPGPVVLFDPGVLPTHLQMKLVVQVRSVFDRGAVQSAVRAEIYRRLREEGISPPVVRS